VILFTFELVKKVLTLFLLVLFLLNVVGYYGVLVGLRSSVTEKWRQSVDRDATGAQLIFKIPLAIPYAVDATEYSSVDGEFEHQGEVFRLVKQKLTHDTLYIVCVKDNASKKINQALADYVKTFSDKPFNAKQNSKSIQPISKDFFSTTTILKTDQSGFDVAIHGHEAFSSFYSFHFQAFINQPPEHLS